MVKKPPVELKLSNGRFNISETIRKQFANMGKLYYNKNDMQSIIF